MAGLIDSGVVIQLERRGQSPESLTTLAPRGAVAIASITASELLVGVHRAAPLQRRSRRGAFVELVLALLPVVPFDLAVARVHACLAADLAAIGQPVGANDLLIAATAIAHGYEVVTFNVREFARVPGLAVVRPDWEGPVAPSGVR